MATPSPEEIDAFMHYKNGTHETRIGLILGIEIPLVVLMVSVVCLRFYARSRVKAAFGGDDWTMGLATVIAAVNTTLSCVATMYGAGVHAWDIQMTWIEPGAKLGWWYGLLFIPSVSLTKISICMTYLRIFPGKKDRIFCHGMIAYQVLSGLAIFLAIMLQCLPIYSYWDLSVVGKKCYNQELASQVTSALNSVSDFAVFLWPAPNIWKIQLPVKQRLALIFVFSLGCVVCVAGVIRIWYYTVYFQSKDVFWSAAILYIVSDIECNLGIICGSLPEIRPLLTRWWTNTTSTASNLTRLSSGRQTRRRKTGGRPEISAPLASPYVMERVESRDDKFIGVPSTESFGKGYQSYQRISKTGFPVPTSPYAIRYDEKGNIHRVDYGMPKSSESSSPETIRSPLQQAHEIYETHDPRYDQIQQTQHYSPPHPHPLQQQPYHQPPYFPTPPIGRERAVQSAMDTRHPRNSYNHRYSMDRQQLSRPRTAAADHHDVIPRERHSTLSEDLGSVEMWVSVDRGSPRPSPGPLQPHR